MPERAGVRRARAAAAALSLVALVAALGAGVAAQAQTAEAQTAEAPPAAAARAASAPRAVPLSDDPALEAEVMRIAHDLRCLVCQNESIAASNADLAVDLRGQIRSQLRAGRSDREIIEYMVERYGDFVLFKPPVKPTTWPLWGGPFVLLVAMAWWLARTLRRRRAEVAAAQRPLSDDERRRARELLGTASE